MSVLEASKASSARRQCPSLTYFRTLTEYGAVSAESPASQASGSPAAAAVDESRPSGIDVRTLEWMRPLVGEYAFNFQKLARSVRRQSGLGRSGWADAIARSHAHPRDPAIARSHCRAAGTSRRARRGARSGCASRGSAERSSSRPDNRPACSAVRSSRCSRPSPRSSSRRRCPPTMASRRCRCSGSTPKITIGRRFAAARCSIADFQPRRSPSRIPTVPVNCRSRSSNWTSGSQPPSTISSRPCQRPTSPMQVIDGLRRRVPAGVGMAEAFSTLDRNGARSARARRVRGRRPGGESSRWPRCSRASSNRQAVRPLSRPQAVKNCGALDISRRSFRSPAASRCFT